MGRLMARLTVLKWDLWALKNMLTKAPWHVGYVYGLGENNNRTEDIIIHER